MIRKWLTIGIILLFLGVTIAPTINFNTVKASQEDDLVEVTTQACGIQGYGNTIVKLTREQYQNLEPYLVEFRARLNQTSTREEAIPIFKEAVAELDKYGLLPTGMSVERVQRLVTSSYDKREKIVDTLNLDPDANYFCLVSGKTTNTLSYGPLATVADDILLLIFLLLSNPRHLSGTLLGDFINWFLNILWIIKETIMTISAGLFFIMLWTGGLFSVFSPIGLLTLLTFGYTTGNYENDKYPSAGWVYSIGLTGMKKYNGSELWGNSRTYPYIAFPFATLYPGLLGFCGLKIRSSSGYSFFLGTALKVKIGTEFPG
ncbi:MAG: hypothetical protein MUC80_00990 [Candidatus Thermoplasmatota archaeon]|jgi:hypothetical protein|nr:hypothetical protein [Candidatus Thermoplasmatota archaeon]